MKAAAMILLTCAAILELAGAQTITTTSTANTLGASSVNRTVTLGPSVTRSADTVGKEAALGELPELRAGASQITVKRNCPSGYVAADSLGTDAHMTVCEVRKSPLNSCGLQPGFYACGRGASECCAAGTDNRCFSGAFACTSPVLPFAKARTACCMSH